MQTPPQIDAAASNSGEAGVAEAPTSPPHPDAAPSDFEQTCWRLAGFNDRISPEWVDGYLVGVVAGPRAVPLPEWLHAMLGDDFDRVFADPADARQAQRALGSRWRELAQQLDAEWLLEDPQALQLSPWLLDYEDADREAFVAHGHGSAQQAADELRAGVAWSRGFLQALSDFAADWTAPAADAPDGERYHEALECIRALQQPGGPTGDAREEWIDAACLAAQTLRLYWVDHAPKPTTRRVEAQPGRNDPCHCGSGLKFKKCHGR